MVVLGLASGIDAAKPLPKCQLDERGGCRFLPRCSVDDPRISVLLVSRQAAAFLPAGHKRACRQSGGHCDKGPGEAARISLATFSPGGLSCASAIRMTISFAAPSSPRRQFGALGFGATLSRNAAPGRRGRRSLPSPKSRSRLLTAPATPTSCTPLEVHCRRARMAGHLRSAPRIPRHGQAAGGVRVCRAHGQPLLSLNQGNARQSGRCVQLCEDAQRHHACVGCEGIRGLAGCAEGR
jgi:hypothetical protein